MRLALLFCLLWFGHLPIKRQLTRKEEPSTCKHTMKFLISFMRKVRIKKKLLLIWSFSDNLEGS